jgi:hypothetical protein
MKRQNLDLGNSIYQQKNSGSYDGLTVKDGMLINNRPDGQTGISQAAEMRKSMHRAEKISTMATAFSMGEMLSEMGGDCCK